MAGLISRAAAIAQIKENYCDWCDHTDLCQSCETRDCIATIEQQLSAVDAVPVEWLREKIKEHTDEEGWQDYLANSFGLCIEEWQNEQEAMKNGH